MRTLSGALFFAVAAIAASGAISAEPDKADLARKAQEVLKANCYRCHGQEGAVEGGMNYVLDFKTLVARKKVIPGEPLKSKLYKRITSEDNPMPPDDEKIRPSKEDVALIKRWIEAGAPEVASVQAPQRLITESDIIRAVYDDLEKTEESDRRFVRYFTFCHLWNAGVSEDELQTYRHGLSKLVNSLSWGRKIVVPKAIDPAKTILRIDLRDYRWSSLVWTRITGLYPYAIYLPEATAMAVYHATEWDFPYVRGDWFVYQASRPPLYYGVLQLPQTDADLEKELKVEVQANVEGGLVARAAFNGSGVSQHNRMIERHESPYGAYWKSYDFASDVDRQNLFRYPLGPGAGPHDFKQDGGEIIFALPNGLQGYMLVNGRGKRINEGPTKIVSDPRQPDKSVVNGVSCMSCHVRGLIEKDDQVRETVLKNAASFSEREVATVKAIYPPREKFASLIQDDKVRFKNAVEQTGARITTTDPVVAVATRFDQELDLKMAAAEAGLSQQEFSKRLGQSASLSRTLGSLNVAGGTVQRLAFAAEFNAVVRELRLGISRTLVNSVGMSMRYVPAGEFMMGSADDDNVSRSNERPRHLVRITKPFYMGIFPVSQGEYQHVLGKNPSWFGPHRGSPADFPVDNVSWNEAQRFCKALSDMDEEGRSGRHYRLPTEAEWEYACRAGTTTRFAFGDSISTDLANFMESEFRRPIRSHEYPPNRFGLFMMHGNIAQLCQDWYEPNYYQMSPINDPPGPSRSKEHVRIIRGGSWGEPDFWMRSSARNGVMVDQRQANVGFRVVCVVE